MIVYAGLACGAAALVVAGAAFVRHIQDRARRKSRPGFVNDWRRFR